MRASTPPRAPRSFSKTRQLLWGSAPWHIGILVVLLGHLVALFLPGVWSSLLTVPGVLLAVETIGVACSLLAIAGMATLIDRRLTSARVQAVTTTVDLVVVALLLAQVVLGLLTRHQFPLRRSLEHRHRGAVFLEPVHAAPGHDLRDGLPDALQTAPHRRVAASSCCCRSRA